MIQARPSAGLLVSILMHMKFFDACMSLTDGS